MLYLSTLGQLRNPTSQHDVRAIALKAYRDALRAGPTNSYSEYLAVTTRALRTYEAAAAMRADPTAVVAPPVNATDPTAPPGTTGYRYRVVVDVFEGGQRIGSTAVTVTSSEPLTAQEAGFEAQAVARGELPGRDSLPSVTGLDNPAVQFRTTVISSGRA